MTTKQMKKKYNQAPDEWIALWSPTLEWMNHGEWYKSKKPAFIDENHYKLIHIKHKKVLKAYLADDKVEIWMDNVTPTKERWGGSYRVSNFIEDYEPDLEYRLKETKRSTDNSGWDDFESMEFTRIEVISEEGRIFSQWLKKGHYKMSIQDDGKTIKLFKEAKND
jgi:hypothetical protein